MDQLIDTYIACQLDLIPCNLPLFVALIFYMKTKGEKSGLLRLKLQVAQFCMLIRSEERRVGKECRP